MATTRDDVLRQLRDGITSLTESNNWMSYLDVQSRFHHYSWGNSLLIASQYPEATKVAGYRTWQNLGRQVRRGERAIMILAPVVYNAKPADGEETSENGRVVRGFRSVPVFDYAQTEGEPLPEIATRLEGADPVHAFRRLHVVAGELGYGISVEQLSGTKNGACNFETRRISIQTGIEPAQMVKTLAHELGHAILHNPEAQEQRAIDRRLAELEAESVAYVICRELGIDSGKYSFGYIAGWAGGGEEATKHIEASASQIHRASHIVLDVMQNGMSRHGEQRVADQPRSAQGKLQELSDEMRGAVNVGNGGSDWPEPVHHLNGKVVPSLLMTVTEVCETLRVSRAQLYVMATKDHLIEMVHIGRLCRIPRASVEAYVDSIRQAAPAIAENGVHYGEGLQ